MRSLDPTPFAVYFSTLLRAQNPRHHGRLVISWPADYERSSHRTGYCTTHISLPPIVANYSKLGMSDTKSTSGVSDWRSQCNARKALQDASIPEAWRVQVPPDTSLDVRSVTEDCRLLSPRELGIIDLGTKDVSALARLLADKNSGYTGVEVTTAYLKSAIVAHQVVSLCSRIGTWFSG